MNSDRTLPEREASGPPKVVFWFKVYAGFMALLYFAVLVAGVLLVVFAPQSGNGIPLTIMGAVYIALGFVLALAYSLVFAFKPSPGSWVFHLILICIGFGGCPTIAAAVPLLIFWIKPEIKRFYGRSD